MHRFVKLLIVIASLIAACPAVAKDWKIIRIATEGAFPPFNSVYPDGTLKGFDVDIAHAVCDRMKVECTIVTQDWDGIIPGLTGGKYDAIFASMSITDKRKEIIDFSDKYYQMPSIFAVSLASGISEITPSALAGRAIGAQSSTIQAEYLESHYPRAALKLYPSQDDVNLDLAAGRIDGLLTGKANVMDWLKTEAGRCCKAVGPDIEIGGPVGAGVRKEDQDLKAMINAALAAIIADGTYAAINAKYFPYSIYGN